MGVLLSDDTVANNTFIWIHRGLSPGTGLQFMPVTVGFFLRCIGSRLMSKSGIRMAERSTNKE